MIDDRDQIIMKILLENPEGLQYSRLLEIILTEYKDKFAKRTFEKHLLNLVNDKKVLRIEAKEIAKNAVIYKILISEEDEKRIKEISESFFLFQDLLNDKHVSNDTLIGFSSQFLDSIANNSNYMLGEYFFEKNGEIRYEIFEKIRKEKFSIIKKLMKKRFSKKEMNRIFLELELISELRLSNSNQTNHDVVAFTNKLRTKEEIIFDNTFITYPEDINYFSDAVNIPEIENFRVKNKIEELKLKLEDPKQDKKVLKNQFLKYLKLDKFSEENYEAIRNASFNLKIFRTYFHFENIDEFKKNWNQFVKSDVLSAMLKFDDDKKYLTMYNHLMNPRIDVNDPSLLDKMISKKSLNEINNYVDEIFKN